jgi:hypothetical protein
VQWDNCRLFVARVGLVVFVGAGYVTGRADLQRLIFFGVLAAMFLSLCATIRPRAAERIAGVVLLAWIGLAAVTEQFAWAGS